MFTFALGATHETETEVDTVTSLPRPPPPPPPRFPASEHDAVWHGRLHVQLCHWNLSKKKKIMIFCVWHFLLWANESKPILMRVNRLINERMAAGAIAFDFRCKDETRMIASHFHAKARPLIERNESPVELELANWRNRVNLTNVRDSISDFRPWIALTMAHIASGCAATSDGEKHRSITQPFVGFYSFTMRRLDRMKSISMVRTLPHGDRVWLIVIVIVIIALSTIKPTIFHTHFVRNAKDRASMQIGNAIYLLWISLLILFSHCEPHWRANRSHTHTHTQHSIPRCHPLSFAVHESVKQQTKRFNRSTGDSETTDQFLLFIY